MSSKSSPAALAAVGAAAVSVAGVALYKVFSSKTSSSPNTSNSKIGSAFILAGDIGGTNSRLALFDPAHCGSSGSGEPPTPLYTHTYRNTKALKHGDADLTFPMDVILPFLTDCFEKQGIAERDGIVACFAVAGPVRQNRVVMTNVGEHHSPDVGKPKQVLVVDGALIEATRISYLSKLVRVRIVNDFVGQGYGALDLDLDKECIELVPGSKSIIGPLGPKVCVGAGTGLGECYLTISSLAPDTGYECYASEGGHVEFSPRSDLEIELLQYLKEKFKQSHRVSVERVVSGKGLANVYEFLAKKYPDRVDKAIHSKFVAAGDMQGAVVGMNAGIKGSLMEQAMHIMVGAYGSEAGSAALKFIPTGGLYVTGGLTPKNISFLEGSDSPFLKAFFDKGRVSPLLDTVPLFAVMEEDIGLRGARVCAMREYNSICS
mmetsp:Transcript_19532/g.39575  ORF Transcript_19532/g.39575 Transcript_19532/m.39575 type:complete len:432 (-) Transcript_19532:545-1840(-)